MTTPARKLSATRIIKLSLLWTLVAPPVALVMAIVLYDIAVFLPHRPQFDAITARASAEDLQLNDAFMKAVQFVDGDSGITRTVTRNLLTSTYLSDGRLKGWQIHFALWNLLVPLHLPSEQIATFYRVMAVPSGVNALSMQMYGKSINELNEEQLLRVAVTIRAPQRYLKNPDALNRRVHDLQHEALKPGTP